MSDPFSYVMDQARAAFDEPALVGETAVRGVFDQAATIIQMGGFGAIDTLRPTLTIGQAAAPTAAVGQTVMVRGHVYQIGRIEVLPGDELRLILEDPS